ncbi:unnamed protein product [Meganyctiphanes norvegica]|uniref:Protein sleepless n=1 Tax=Meganyctiphanes norvegica TaxID=48144 RepID=A0AAV2SJZ0_MEGNR
MEVIRCYLLLLLSSLIAVGDGIACYRCSNSMDSYLPYDETCAYYDYKGNQVAFTDWETCWTSVNANGVVSRSASVHGSDGECSYDMYVTTCYCTGDLCNDQHCEHCQGKNI